MKLYNQLLLWLTISLTLALSVEAKDSKAINNIIFDTVIINGRVIDPETSLDGIRNIGIVNGQIKTVTKAQIKGRKSIDAKGLVVSAGFIDLHAHGQNLSSYRMQAMQGVTTALELESGVLPIAAWYEQQADKKLPINYGAAAGWTFARIATFQNSTPEATVSYFQKAQADSSWKDDIATKEQTQEILALVEQGIAEGGLGIGINGGYAPGYGRKEYYELAKLAKKHEVGTYTHARYSSIPEPKSTFEAFEELIALSAITGAKMHICHINSNSLKDIEATLELFEQAQKQGIAITAGAYPWGAASTVLGAAMFDVHGWKERMGFDETSFQIGARRLDAESFAKERKSAPGSFMSYHQLDESKPEDLAMLDRSVTHADILIESDGMPWYDSKGQPYEGDEWPIPTDLIAHPRSSGTFAKVLGSYVRERKLLTLSQAINKMSLMPAKTLESYVPQMKKKGRLQAGMDADIVIFDLNKIEAVGTYAEPYHAAKGVKYLLVAGNFVIKNEKLIESASPGEAIRR